MKNKKGVSMIELVLVIIIILIITTFAIFSGRESVEQATITEVYTEMQAIRNAANSFNVKKEIDENFNSGDYYGQKVSELGLSEIEFETAYGISIESEDFEKLYIIYGIDTPDYKNSEYKYETVKNSYSFDNIKHTYLVNFEDVEVSLLKSINIGDKRVRTFEEVRAFANNG